MSEPGYKLISIFPIKHHGTPAESPQEQQQLLGIIVPILRDPVQRHHLQQAAQLWDCTRERENTTKHKEKIKNVEVFGKKKLKIKREKL